MGKFDYKSGAIMGGRTTSQVRSGGNAGMALVKSIRQSGILKKGK